MKVENAFPIAEISGTKRPENKQTFYVYHKQQCVRTYSAPQPPYNSSFCGAKDFNDEILIVWKDLSHLEYSNWVLFTKYWNEMLPEKILHYNPWLAFYTINFYRLLDLAEITRTPPLREAARHISDVKVVAPSNGQDSLIFYYWIQNFPWVNYKLVTKTTRPHTGYCRAYRSSENKLIEGFSHNSIITIPTTHGVFCQEVKTPKYNFQPGSFFHVSTKILTPDYFPSHSSAGFIVEAQEGLMLVSVGADWETKGALDLLGSCQNTKEGEPCWQPDSVINPQHIEAHRNGLIITFPISYYEGSVLDAIIIKMRGDHATTGIKCCIEDNDMSDTEPNWTSLGACWEVKGDGLKIDTHEISPITFEHFYAHRLKIESLITDGSVAQLIGVGFRTTKRYY